MNIQYTDLTIKQFKAIQKIVSRSKKDEDINAFIQILSVVENKPESYYYDLPISVLNEELAKLSFLKEKFKPNQPNDSYMVEGIKYNLTMNPQNMTAGQYIDYTNTLSERQEDYASLLAILLIPKGKKYGDGYSISELSETLSENFKMADALGICFFFTQLLKTLTKVTLDSLTRTLKKEMKKEKNPERINEINKSIEAISGFRS